MVDPFHRRIQTALQDSQLQAALDANAKRRNIARLQATAQTRTDWEGIRERSRRVRARTIENLDEYLTEFIERAQGNGIRVHLAENASQAIQIVLEIARSKQAGQITKSKSMLSEEIGLNHALEAAGIQAIETDLGEYIVQLRGERPAHIITPAVHLDRKQVGKTFHEKLGLPFTDDIPTLVSYARRLLRQSFLDSPIGVSGVNFGVVETGAMCLVTNEGNGRMVTTLPPTHIALMGIERLLPTLDDLALMLSILASSASGQKLTAYTSMIQSPRKPGDEDGPLERHLILIDNGRRKLRDSPLAESLNCIRCGACLNVCPVFREIGGHAYVDDQNEGAPYPGPIGSVLSPGLLGQRNFAHLARASSLCGACKDACPVNVDLPKLLLRVRAGGTIPSPKRASGKVPWKIALGLQLYAWLVMNPRIFLSSLKALGFFSSLASPRSAWLRMPAFTGWGYSKDLPRPDKRPFHSRWPKLSREVLPNNEAPIRLGPKVMKSAELISGDPPAKVPQSLLNQFAEELISNKSQFTFCKRNELEEKIGDLLVNKEKSTLFSWTDENLPAGVLSGLMALGVPVAHTWDPAMEVGLTGALAAIAETGTLVLTAGPGRPQLASLLPEVHIVLLDARNLYSTLAEVLQLPEIRATSTVTLISGPSRTGDIEMTQTIGVHGPREVHVLCWDE